MQSYFIRVLQSSFFKKSFISVRSIYKLRFLILFIVLFLNLPIVCAQQKGSGFGMLDILQYFEKDKGIFFSYNPELVKNQKVEFDSSIDKINQIQLANLIAALKKHPFMDIKKKDDTYLIFVRNKKITITGKLIDMYSGKAIAGVMISDTYNSVFSDEAGNFELLTKTWNTLYISDPLYSGKKIAVYDYLNEKVKKIELFQQSESLDEVILRNEFLTFGVDKQRDGSISISPNDLKILPGLIEPNIMQSIELLPGVNSSSEGVRDVSARGNTSDHNLLLWDGIKMYNSGHLFDKLPVFNPYIIDNAGVFRSGTSVRYGGHVAGVIDISSISQVPEKIKGSIGTSMTTADANIQLPIGKKIGLVLAGRHSANHIFPSSKFSQLLVNSLNTQGLDPNADTFKSITNSFSFFDYNAKLILHLSEFNKIMFSTIGSKNLFNSSQEIDFDKNPELIGNVNENREEKINFRNFGSSVNWKSRFSNAISTHFITQYSTYNYERLTNYEIVSGSRFSGNTRINSVFDFSTQINANFDLKKLGNIRAGGDYTLNRYKVVYQNTNQDSSVLNYNEKLETNGVFAEYNFVNSFLVLKSGIRANRYPQISVITLEPRLLGGINFLKHFTFNATFERKSQAIRQDQQDPNISSRSFIESNHLWLGPTAYFKDQNNNFNTFDDQIPILLTNQITAGIACKYKGWDIDLESFFKMNGGIVSINTQETNSFTIARGTGEAYGIDVLVKKKIKKFRTWLGYSYLENLVKFPSIQTDPFPSSYNYKHILNWSHTLDFQNFQLGFSWNYKSGAPYSIPTKYNQTLSGEGVQFTDFNIQYATFNNFTLPDYHRLNASILYSFKWSKHIGMKLGASVQNLLDTKNVIGRGFSENPRNTTNTITVPIPEDVFFGGSEDTKTLYQNDNFGQPRTIDFLVRVSF